MLQGHMWEQVPDSAAPQSAMQQALQGTLAVHTLSCTGEAALRSAAMTTAKRSG